MKLKRNNTIKLLGSIDGDKVVQLNRWKFRKPIPYASVES